MKDVTVREKKFSEKNVLKIFSTVFFLNKTMSTKKITTFFLI